MSDNNINLTAPIHAATKLGKAVAAREVFMDGDNETVQQIGEKTHQLEDAIKDITVSGGASTATAVSYNNETSGITAVTAQGAIDELVTKNKSQDTIIAAKAEKSEVQTSVSELKTKNTLQDAEIAKKANSADVASQMQTEQSRVNTELEKKFDKESITQESGEAEDKVMSQKAVSDKLSDLNLPKNDINILQTVSKTDTVLFVGDSITRGHTSASTITEKNWVNLFAKEIGFKYKNISVAGSGYTNNKKIISQLKSEDLSVYSCIFIAAGTNDNNAHSDLILIENAIQECIDYINEYNAKIYL